MEASLLIQRAGGPVCNASFPDNWVYRSGSCRNASQRRLSDAANCQACIDRKWLNCVTRLIHNGGMVFRGGASVLMQRLHALQTRKREARGSKEGKLPEELLVVVALHLDSADKQAMRLACRAWQSAVSRTISRLRGSMYHCNNAQLRTAAAWFPHVASVNLSQCSATDLSPLLQLRQLRVLELNGCCALPARALQCLAALPRLSKLDLSGCTRAATDEGMRHVACCRDSLAWLSLQCCPGLTGTGLSQLRGFSRLLYLDLSETAVRSTRCLQGCNALVSLRLAGCERLQEGALAGLAALPNLARLDLCRSGAALLSPASLRSLSALPGLTLDLEGSEGMTDAECSALTRLQGLTQLVLTECPFISVAGLEMVVTGLRGCKVFSGCC